MAQDKNRLKNGYHFQRFTVRTFFLIIDFLGSILVSPFIRKSAKHPESLKKRKILLCKNDHLGDVTIFLQVLPAIRNLFHNDEIHLVAGAWAKPLLENNPYIDKVIYFNHFLLNRNKNLIYRFFEDIISRITVLANMLKDRYDIAIDFRSYFPNMIPLLFFGMANWKVGFATAGFGFLLNETVDWRENIPETEHFMDLLKGVGSSEPSKNGLDYLGNPDNVNELFKNYKINENQQIVVLHPFGGHRTKQWDNDSWKKVMLYLSEKNYKTFIIGKGDTNPFSSVIDDTNIFDIINKTDVSLLAGLIKKARFVISIDSFPAQLSAALKKPTLVLMTGIENKSQWYNGSKDTIVIQKDVDCSPCYKKNGCPEMKCMDFDSDKVISVLESKFQ